MVNACQKYIRQQAGQLIFIHGEKNNNTYTVHLGPVVTVQLHALQYEGAGQSAGGSNTLHITHTLHNGKRIKSRCEATRSRLKMD